jgi:hypothetical protein
MRESGISRRFVGRGGSGLGAMPALIAFLPSSIRSPEGKCFASGIWTARKTKMQQTPDSGKIEGLESG